ncbi:Cysteine desulfurase [Colletotrichum higginsianum IMI 349063]|uniref:Cysteine desulfurase n=1 Tax=Colletotrichum higginsianum (strain IMI 349063) TaxID=759273 RepID=A0A1B7Y4Q1_COLHI|nr:Cysteine desulfurase [Colletotrichum higginsianum IMI 349063]OBR06963.1 Cysteine desulfurase [Colletotrichum higginsianum IMI 349063]
MDPGPRSRTQVLAALEPPIQALDREAVITHTDALYRLHSEPYAIQKQLNPAVVLVPDTVEQLTAIVKFLYGSNLDFVIRGHGFKPPPPPARHVVVSMLKFKDLDYDPVKKIATIGASATWFEVVSFMEQVDPEYSGGQPILATFHGQDKWHGKFLTPAPQAS